MINFDTDGKRMRFPVNSNKQFQRYGGKFIQCSPLIGEGALINALVDGGPLYSGWGNLASRTDRGRD